jgi:hypothetical protein
MEAEEWCGAACGCGNDAIIPGPQKRGTGGTPNGCDDKEPSPGRGVRSIRRKALSLWILVKGEQTEGWLSYANGCEFEKGILKSEFEKRGVPRLHVNMLPANSFPQICVVSVPIMCKFAHWHKST